MTLESQVTSLKLSQRLQKLGFPQESYFKWVEHFYNMAKSLPSEPPRKWDVYSQDWEMEALSEDSVVSAYSVAELGEMLPRGLIVIKGQVGFHIGFQDDLWNEHWGNKGLILTQRDLFDLTHSNTEAEARGEMLAYLKENNLI